MNIGVIESNKRRAKHRMCGTKTHRAWCDMRQRCLNHSNPRYSDYGGRGIKICQRWDSFLNFLADMGIKPPGMSIGRIDNNGDYSPGNCRWESREQQQRNRRNSRILEWNGVRLTAVEWAEKLGMKENAIRSRIRKNWTVEKIITLPYRPRL